MHVPNNDLFKKNKALTSMMSKYSKVLIIPYFGKIPPYFKLWAASCSFNKDYSFFIYTDQDFSNIKKPDNVHIKAMEICEIWMRLSKILNVDVSNFRPYKLCDLKPAYGELFYDDIKAFDFWGYCDTDLIWGNIDSFLPDKILEKYNKIFNLGHFTLYKNDIRINKLYRKNKAAFIEVFQNDDICHFDEGPYPDLIPIYEKNNLYAPLVYDKVNNINHIFWQERIPIYTDFSSFADIHAYHDNLQIAYASSYSYKDPHRKGSIFIWENGILRRYYVAHGTINSKEYMYIHLQKRKMDNMVFNLSQGFVIRNHTFEDKPLYIDIQYLKTSNLECLPLKIKIKLLFSNCKVFIRQNIARFKFKTGIDLLQLFTGKKIILYND